MTRDPTGYGGPEDPEDEPTHENWVLRPYKAGYSSEPMAQVVVNGSPVGLIRFPSEESRDWMKQRIDGVRAVPESERNSRENE